MYGPLTGFGTWAFERNNGALAKINHNGLERDVASTCLRIWLLEFLLAAKISNPAPDATITEKAALETLLTDKAAVQGTLMLEEARGNAANHQIRLPTPLEKGHVIDLQRFHAYRPLLEYVQTNYPQYGFADAAYVMGDAPCLPVRSTAYKIYTHAVYTGFKFCSELYSRTRSDQYALASRSVGDPNGPRHLCRLKLFLSIRLRVDHIREPLQLTLALVEFLEEAKGLYPWQYRSIDLGIRIYRRIFKRSTFIPIDNMKASTIVTPLQTHADGPCLVSTSCEKDGVEPEFWLNADADQDVDEDADVDDQEF
ncbi:hypothetical protein FFLO_04670 [Filobasidium floriforme]|uniref:Uncharacterized protein n=1 Tax=Filobasidium floriforme TaxID=5210 RepID=A0A8K0JI89_9TREE|nr:hypothetical protein FFLO_04670 [Filobasidium floriforme]